MGVEDTEGLVDVDARGTYCPIPILRLAAALRARPSGTRARLRSTDPASRSDVEAYCREGRGRLVSAAEAEGVLTFEIEKTGDRV